VESEGGGMKNEHEYSLKHANPHYFIGTKPAAVLFGEERVDVRFWSNVYKAIYERVNQDPQAHEDLMYLRNKVAGKVRVFISDLGSGMTKPLKVDDDLFVETHYGVETMFHIMVDCILKYVRCDISNIKIIVKR
jgi:hypothetical protein